MLELLAGNTYFNISVNQFVVDIKRETKLCALIINYLKTLEL